MSSIKIGKENTINVYEFMRICGLECKNKDNVLISHKIMLRKLELRHNLFPREVIVPKKIPFKFVKKEDILRGRVLIVRDDYNDSLAFINPINLSMVVSDNLSDEEKEIKRQELIDEEMNKEKVTFTPGYIKYLIKQAERENMKKIEELRENQELSINDEEVSKKVLCKKRVDMYSRRGFGRR